MQIVINGETFDCADGLCQDIDIICLNQTEACNVYCTSTGSCLGKEITCADNTECNIICSGVNSCSEGIIDNGRNGEQVITAINCPLNASCNIECTGFASCNGAPISCPTGSECNIDCGMYSSCKEAEISGPDANRIDLLCTQPDSCIDLTIFCPPNVNGNKLCKITGNDDFTHEEFEIFAVNSWNDIDFSGYPINIFGNQNTMRCGDNYRFLCGISQNEWNCINPNSPCFVENPLFFSTPIPETTDFVSVIAETA